MATNDLREIDRDVRGQLDPNERRNFIGFEALLRQPQTERGAPTKRADANAAVDRIKAIRAQQSAQQQAMLDSIRNKILYANVMGVPDKSLIPMAALSKAGISAAPGAGIPYGLDPRSLTADERVQLGLPLDGEM